MIKARLCYICTHTASHPLMIIAHPFSTPNAQILATPMASSDSEQHPKTLFAITNECLDNKLKRFWEIEEVFTPVKRLSPQEEFCEQHFQQHTTRNADGKFSVSMPLLQDRTVLGTSINTAYRRFISLEHKLEHNLNIKEQYIEFMQTYENLGHMTEVDTFENCAKQDKKHRYFLPHHAVIKDSSTTNLRVVFDASMATSTGLSLNDIQAVGPVLQDSLQDIMLRFRKHNIAVSSDIEKMYRMVEVNVIIFVVDLRTKLQQLTCNNN